MTRSRASPDGRIPKRDVAAKLVIIMVGLPARGKSYLTKKIQRYLSWQQHNSRIFNVGNRRRVIAGAQPSGPSPSPTQRPYRPSHAAQVASILLNGAPAPMDYEPSSLNLDYTLADVPPTPVGAALGDLNTGLETTPESPAPKLTEQSASFFDPLNEEASRIREQLAVETLDELLDYLLVDDGVVGILDATNSTIERRELLFQHIKAREPKLGILIIESVCNDQAVSA